MGKIFQEARPEIWSILNVEYRKQHPKNDCFLKLSNSMKMKKAKSIFVFLMVLFSVESFYGQSPSGYYYNQAKAFNT